MWWYMPIVLANWKTEAGGSPEARDSSPAWAAQQNLLKTKQIKSRNESKGIVIKTLWYWHKYRHTDWWNRIVNPETLTFIVNLFEGNSVRTKKFFKEWCWDNWPWITELYFIPLSSLHIFLMTDLGPCTLDFWTLIYPITQCSNCISHFLCVLVPFVLL